MSRLRRFMLLCACVAFLAVAGMLVQPMYREQVQYDLTNAPVRGAGPTVVLATTALGAFRGIIVDIIWIRMENLKQQDKFFEIVQLADLACKLSPQFSKVWDFNAWNMAYNISVEIPQLDERWAWVKKGLELLRDQGIPNNPTEPQLYFSLGWTYLHKVGDQLDDAHFFYKAELGLEMHEVLGGPGTKEELERIAKAPRTSRELLADPQVKEFHDRLLAAGWDPLEKISGEGILNFFLWPRNPGLLSQAARALMEDERNKEAVRKIADHARALRLEQIHLVPEKMIAVMDEFGPFDWRGPYAHAVYWATEGMKAANSYKERVKIRRKRHNIAVPMDEFEEGTVGMEYGEINYDRTIYGALQNLVTRGRLLFGSRGQMMPAMGPDYRFTEALTKHFQKVIAKYKETDRFMTGLSSAYENFLKRMVTEYFYQGDEMGSRRYYALLAKEFPKAEYRATYDEFMNKQITEYVNLMGAEECRKFARGLLIQSYLWAGAGDDERALELHEMASNTARLWNKVRGDATSPEPNLTQRVDFDQMKEQALMEIFGGWAGFPPEVIERLEKRLDPDVVKKIKDGVAKMKDGGQLKPMEVKPEDKKYKP